MTDLDDAALDAIEQRANNATPGQWIAGWVNDWKGRATVVVALDGDQVDGTVTGQIELRDAEFIAHAPEDIRALLAAVREARAAATDAEQRAQAAQEALQRRGECHCNGFPYPDLSRLAEMDGYLKELTAETGDTAPLQFWREIRRSINAPIRDRIRRALGDDQQEAS